MSGGWKGGRGSILTFSVPYSSPESSRVPFDRVQSGTHLAAKVAPSLAVTGTLPD